MATLKSPRNSRKKGEWVRSYALRSQNLQSSMRGQLVPKSKHKMTTFLRNSAYEVLAEQKEGRPVNLWFPEYIEEGRPPVYIKYGLRQINYSKVYPMVMHKHLRDKEMNPRLALWANVNSLSRWGRK